MHVDTIYNIVCSVETNLFKVVERSDNNVVSATH